MSNKASQLHILELESDELPVVRAAISSALDGISTAQPNGNDRQQLLALQQTVKQLSGNGSHRVALTRTDVELLRIHVTTIMAMRGYVVARPAAILTMTTVRQKLDRMLSGSRWAEMRKGAGEIL